MSFHASAPAGLGGMFYRDWWYWEAWMPGARSSDPPRKLYQRGPMLSNDGEARSEFNALFNRPYRWVRGRYWDGSAWRAKPEFNWAPPSMSNVA